MRLISVCLILFLAWPMLALAGCPFGHGGSASVTPRGTPPYHEQLKYEEALSQIDFNAVKEDIKKVLIESRDFWPADNGNYGPFMIRQAWHCAGSYRIFDGRGGCEGGRQRFNPERSWDDNTNLDKSKTILWPIKQKYGLGLSWGDLIILTGTTAIESMGGPVFGFCGGRIDDYDGSESLVLGPTPEQEASFPCSVNGECTAPFGTTTIGLIYVNPEGPMNQPIPEKSAEEVRATFGRMNMDDEETVALIGGGHAFGRTHGACPAGAGPSPIEDPSNPWPGLCGTGKGRDAFTSGFNGPWTVNPTEWDNGYYKELLNNQWEVYIGPGGRHQWRTVNGTQGIMMLTSDISLLHDPKGEYQKYVKLFATNQTALEDAFSRAWYKLTTRDQGPYARCVGPWVPEPQPFQNPLPATPASLPNFEDVKKAILDVIHSSDPSIKPDFINSSPSYASLFVQLAHQCASSHRSTDHIGGCNGARIRFSPEADFPINAEMDKVIGLLQGVYDSFKDQNLSWADLIVLAGHVGLESADYPVVPFCSGRTDATEGNPLIRQLVGPNSSIAEIKAYIDMSGLTTRDYIALSARPRSQSQLYAQGYEDVYAPHTFSNEYFTILLSNKWEKYTTSQGKVQYTADGTNILPSDAALAFDPEFLAIAQEYAQSEVLLARDFAHAWMKLMALDMFDGPASNKCFRHYANQASSPLASST